MEAAEQISWQRGTPPEVVFEDFSLDLGGRPILRDVSVSFPRGEVSAVIGPKGGGKSSLLRSNVRMEHFSGKVTRRRGVVRIDGRDVNDPELDVRSLRRRAVLVPASTVCFPATVRGNLEAAISALPSAEMKVARERFRQVLDAFQMEYLLLSESAMNLPAIDQRLLCVARALVLNPDLLLLDDPFEGLDPFEISRMERVLGAISGDHTVIIATQAVNRASVVASRLTLMIGGRVVESGPSSEILGSPKEARTEAYLSGRLNEELIEE